MLAHSVLILWAVRCVLHIQPFVYQRYSLYIRVCNARSRRLSGFSEIGRLAFGSPGRVIGGVFSQFLLFSTPTLYIILAGDNLSKLVAAAGISIGRQACTWMAAAAVGIPFVLVRTMRDISFVRYIVDKRFISFNALTVTSLASLHPCQLSVSCWSSLSCRHRIIKIETSMRTTTWPFPRISRLHSVPLAFHSVEMSYFHTWKERWANQHVGPKFCSLPRLRYL